MRKKLRLKLPLRSQCILGIVWRDTLLFLSISSLLLNVGVSASPASAQPLGSFNYEFAVDEDGFTIVSINYSSNREGGSSWVFVPKYSEWSNLTVKGVITNWSLSDTVNLTGGEYYFYEVLRFSFKSVESKFEMNIKFNVTTAAMIIEPDGIFYSPQISFEKGNRLSATATFPRGFRVRSGEALAYGDSGSYRPSSTGSNSNYVSFDSIPETENMVRIEIGFRTLKGTAEMLELKSGIFTFKTVERYANHAEEILSLYNRTYRDFARLFNVTLEAAEVRFFLPSFTYLFSVGGYVPFSGEKIGEIHINIVFTRYVKGYIEVIALHELVHHFLWKAGISPGSLLWFHEGMAQYISMEIANKLGYEGVEMMKREFEMGISQLEQGAGGNLGFLQYWSLLRQPEDVGAYYVAAYYVVSKLAEPRGGLEYYARFFRLMRGREVDSNSAIGYYLSLAADGSVVRTLNDWGFEIPDLYVFSPLLSKVKGVVDGVNPVFQPYKSLADLLYQQALWNARDDSAVRMQFYLAAAVLTARLAPLLTLMTMSAVLFGAILWVLKREGVFSSY